MENSLYPKVGLSLPLPGNLLLTLLGSHVTLILEQSPLLEQTHFLGGKEMDPYPLDPHETVTFLSPATDHSNELPHPGGGGGLLQPSIPFFQLFHTALPRVL